MVWEKKENNSFKVKKIKVTELIFIIMSQGKLTFVPSLIRLQFITDCLLSSRMISAS